MAAYSQCSGSGSSSKCQQRPAGPAGRDIGPNSGWPPNAAPCPCRSSCRMANICLAVVAALKADVVQTRPAGSGTEKRSNRSQSKRDQRVRLPGEGQQRLGDDLLMELDAGPAVQIPAELPQRSPDCPKHTGPSGHLPGSRGCPFPHISRLRSVGSDPSAYGAGSLCRVRKVGKSRRPGYLLSSGTLWPGCSKTGCSCCR